MKKLNKILTFVVIVLALFGIFKINTYANSDKLVVLGGENIGIKLNTGVTVIGKYEVETEDGKLKPWRNSDIEINDIIISVNNLKVSDNSTLLNILSNVETKQVNLELLRNGKKITTNIDIIKNKTNQKSLGLYIKDKIMGVGTLTFIDKETNRFASLGHGIYHNNELYENNKGVILESNVESVKKAIPGDAGEIRSNLNNQVIGYISSNKNTGLYGKGMTRRKNEELIEIATVDEVTIGKAQIVTTLTSNKKEKFDIEIIEVEKQTSIDIKGIKIKITDPKLLAITGGIVQGMSGSPIVQDGKLVGAVSHVVVDNPTIGYGIYAEWMLKDANNS